MEPPHPHPASLNIKDYCALPRPSQALVLLQGSAAALATDSLCSSVGAE